MLELTSQYMELKRRVLRNKSALVGLKRGSGRVHTGVVQAVAKTHQTSGKQTESIHVRPKSSYYRWQISLIG